MKTRQRSKESDLPRQITPTSLRASDKEILYDLQILGSSLNGRPRKSRKGISNQQKLRKRILLMKRVSRKTAASGLLEAALGMASLISEKSTPNKKSSGLKGGRVSKLVRQGNSAIHYSAANWIRSLNTHK